MLIRGNGNTCELIRNVQIEKLTELNDNERENEKLTYQVRFDEIKSALEESFSLCYCLPLGLEGK